MSSDLNCDSNNSPVKNEERDGQHMGVEVKAFLKLAPPSRKIFIVLGMNSNEPVINGGK